jgi:hypothetical protein
VTYTRQGHRAPGCYIHPKKKNKKREKERGRRERGRNEFSLKRKETSII